MNKGFSVAAAFLTVALFSSGAMAQKKELANRPNVRAAQQRGPGQPLIALIKGMYINTLRQQGPQQVELTEDQVNRILPFLNQYLEDRDEIGGARRIRARNQLQQAVRRGATDDELVKLMRDFDRINVDVQASQERFLTNVDPILTVRQRAWLRVWQITMEERIRNLMQQGALQNPPPAPPPPNKPQGR